MKKHRSHPNTIMTKPISIVSVNANRKREAMKDLLNDNIHRIDIILVQEPCWGSIGTDILGPTGQPAWRPIIPVDPIPSDRRPRVMAYVKLERTDIMITPRADLATDLDMQFLEIQQRPFPPFLVGNVYNENDDTHPEGEQWTVERLRKVQLPQTRIIMTGDWNLHHERWEVVLSQSEESRAAKTVEWLDQHGFLIHNSHGVPTYHSHDGRSISTLDLTFSNAQALTEDLVKEWALDKSLCPHSDHTAQRWFIDQGAAEIQNPTTAQYNFKDGDKGAFQRELRKALDGDLGNPIRVLVQASNGELPEPTTAQLDQAAEAFENVLQSAARATIPCRRPSAKAKPYWSKELKACKKEYVIACIKRDQHREREGEPCPELMTIVNRCKRAFRTLHRKLEKAWIEDTLAKATTKTAQSFRKWTTGYRNYPTPPISRGPDQPPAVHHHKKCDALRSTLLPKPAELPHVQRPDFEPRRSDAQHFDLTRGELHNIITSCSPLSAPGEDGIPFLGVQWAWEVLQEEMYALYAWCVKLGYHPLAWHIAILVALRKAGKPDYASPRAYRLISLLICMGKILEKIQAKRLAYHAVSRKVLAPKQFGGVPGKSTTDAALTFVHDVEAAWSHGLVVSALTFDFVGFFDNLNHDLLLSTMRDQCVPLPLVRWTASFLSDRKASLALDGVRDKVAPVRTGVPQGSAVSMILAALYTAPLNAKVKELNAGEEDRTSHLQLITFVDDGKIYVASKSLADNTARLEEAFHAVSEWAARAGLAIDKVKKELMHYSNRREDAKRKEWPKLCLEHAENPDQAVHLEAQNGKRNPTVKWLGIHFDARLNFKSHATALAAKAGKALGAMFMLANTVRGMSQAHLRLLYITCIRPILTYASPVWWKGVKLQIAPLQRVEHQALRWVCAGFRTTPIRALHLEASIPPFIHFLNLQNSNAAIRLNRLEPTHPLLERLGNEWRMYPNQVPADPPPITPKSVKRTNKKTSSTLPPRPTRLLSLSALTSPTAERLTPLDQPPYYPTLLDFPLRNRVTIKKPTPGITKQEAATEHVSLISKIKHNPRHLILYSDGSQLETRNGRRTGLGVVGYWMGQKVIEKAVGLGDGAEVFDAEIIGASWATSLARAFASKDPIISHIHFFIDNSSCLDKLFRCTASPGQAALRTIEANVMLFLDQDPNHRIELSWVPGHCNVEGNERVDKVAKRGATQTPEFTRSTYTHLKRRAKADALHAWHEEWAREPPKGRFAPADRIPPSLQPLPHFVSLPRNVFGRLFQCRTGHAHIGSYYETFVPAEPRSCSCGAPLQSRAGEHILFDCPLFDEHRYILHESDVDADLPSLLGTKEGLQVLAAFIKESGAFTKTIPPLPAPSPVR